MNTHTCANTHTDTDTHTHTHTHMHTYTYAHTHTHTHTHTYTHTHTHMHTRTHTHTYKHTCTYKHTHMHTRTHTHTHTHIHTHTYAHTRARARARISPIPVSKHHNCLLRIKLHNHLKGSFCHIPSSASNSPHSWSLHASQFKAVQSDEASNTKRRTTIRLLMHSDTVDSFFFRSVVCIKPVQSVHSSYQVMLKIDSLVG